jgi:hypothetical protein
VTSLKGQGGRLCAAGRELAVLGEWELHSDQYGMRVGAAVVSYDTYYLPRAKAADVSLELGGKTIRHNGLAVWWDGERLVLEKGETRG